MPSKKYPDIILLPISKDSEDTLDQRTQQQLDRLHKMAKRYPILKETDAFKKMLNLIKKVYCSRDRLIEILELMPLRPVIENWIDSLNGTEQIKYAFYVAFLIDRKIIPSHFASGKEFTVGALRHLAYKSIVNSIEQIDDLKEAKKKVCVECYCSFVKFLDHISLGWFTKGQPYTSKQYSNYRPTIRATFKALSLDEWKKLTAVIAKRNYRDYLITLIMFYGVTRISDVLSLTIDQVDMKLNIIKFRKKKKVGIEERHIEYPPLFMCALKKYIDVTQDKRGKSAHLFITNKGNTVTRSRLNYLLVQASRKAHIKQVSPDSIRATGIDFKQARVSVPEIIQLAPSY